MLRVDFFNKNTLRRYPLRADIAVTSNEGGSIPDSLLCAAQFSVPNSYSELCISRVYSSSNYLNVLISAKLGVTRQPIGYFDGKVVDDFYKLTFSAIDKTVYGLLMVGRREALTELQGTHNFPDGTARIEESLVTYLSPPGVRSLSHDGAILTGRINLTYHNIKQMEDPAQLKLDVVSKETVRVENDPTSSFNSCPTNPIGSMNGVVPDAQGNIDIFGISPVQVRITTTGLSIEVTGVDKATLCHEEKRIPPLIPTSSYLKDITQATVPEWKTWPQYNTA